MVNNELEDISVNMYKMNTTNKLNTI